MHVFGRALASGLPIAHQALGGGGLAHFLIRLFIWHEIWRFIRYLWLIPTVGPFIVVVAVLTLIGLGVWRQQRGPRQRRGGGRGGRGTRAGPRNW